MERYCTLFTLNTNFLALCNMFTTGFFLSFVCPIKATLLKVQLTKHCMSFSCNLEYIALVRFQKREEITSIFLKTNLGNLLRSSL